MDLLCKYCTTVVKDIEAEGLQCSGCLKYVHVNCLNRKSVPGGLEGDIFFIYTCKECSGTANEVFGRDKITWLQAILVAFYHMQKKSPGLARKGYFHWKIHIAAFIDKYWDALFRSDFKRKKKWMGTISGSLSNYSPLYFQSGTSVFNEQGWWTLSYPKLTPNAISQINSKLMLEKSLKKEGGNILNDVDLLNNLLLRERYVTEDELELMNKKDECVSDNLLSNEQYSLHNREKPLAFFKNGSKSWFHSKKNPGKTILPTLENYLQIPKKIMKLDSNSTENSLSSASTTSVNNENESNELKSLREEIPKPVKLLDPLCHYNTSIKNLTQLKAVPLKTKLLGGVREELILSPYSGLHLKPYIWRDVTSFPNWLKLMAEIQVFSNKNNPDFTLPPRYPIDFVHVQPEHILAINSLCNQFFWPGIDMTDCLKYPEFSCVVLYRKLIVAFAFLVPDVKISENYMSFLFTRPGWRNVGIGRFMIYHLTQISMGKDITLHVSVNNPALFLYQKFGFKVEHVDLDFYDKYIRNDTHESKHAFFCRLER